MPTWSKFCTICAKMHEGEGLIAFSQGMIGTVQIGAYCDYEFESHTFAELVMDSSDINSDEHAYRHTDTDKYIDSN